MPTRIIYWNITWGLLVYPICIFSLAIMALGLYTRFNRWRAGKHSEKLSKVLTRIWNFFVYAIFQVRILREPYAGIMHLLIFWGFLVLVIGTALVMIHEDLRINILQGTFYLYFSLILDVSGLAAIIGILMAASRRYVIKAKRLDSDKSFGFSIILIFVILVTGFLVEGIRIAVTELNQHPEWAAWSPVGTMVALVVRGASDTTLLTLHKMTWWFHMLVSFIFIAYCVGWSTQEHILLAPLNIFLARLGPIGAPKPIADFKDKQALGIGMLRDANWKDLFESDACVRCGRCDENCPAVFTGKPLSPRLIVQKIKHQMEREIAALPSHFIDKKTKPLQEHTYLVGGNISEDEIWSCTTCSACNYQCPVFVEPMSKIIELRRNVVMAQGRIPEAAQVAMVSLQKRGHPWTGTPHMRDTWYKDLNVNEASKAANGSLLFWIGCTGALVDRNILVASAMIRILKTAGVEFFVLGAEETCCGDPARRMGNEYLFQSLAKKNINNFDRYHVNTILTTCPHCFNVFKNEYPDFGGHFEVVHHTQFIAKLIEQGKLKLDTASIGAITYHDPCYLGRYNGIYDPPRFLARKLSGDGLNEMANSRDRSFCCGGGGGRAWMEESLGSRINQTRTSEALSTGASILQTACPFCLQMFEDGIVGVDAADQIKVFDVAELVDRAIQNDKATQRE